MHDRDRELLQQALGREDVSEATLAKVKQATKMWHRMGGQGSLPPHAILAIAIMSGEFWEPPPQQNPWLGVEPGTPILVHDRLGSYPATFQEVGTGTHKDEVVVFVNGDPELRKRFHHSIISRAKEPETQPEDPEESESGEDETETPADPPQWSRKWSTVEKGTPILYAPPGEEICEGEFQAELGGQMEGKLRITIPGDDKQFRIVNAGDVRLAPPKED